MFGMIGDRLRKWLDGSSSPTAPTAEAPNGLRPLPSEMDSTNGGAPSAPDKTSTPTCPAAIEPQAVAAGPAYEVTNEN